MNYQELFYDAIENGYELKIIKEYINTNKVSITLDRGWAVALAGSVNRLDVLKYFHEELKIDMNTVYKFSPFDTHV